MTYNIYQPLYQYFAGARLIFLFLLTSAFRFVEPLHNFNKQVKSASYRKQLARKSEMNQRPEQEREASKNGLRWKVWGNNLASKLLRKALAQFIGDIVNGMMGYVPLPVIMNKILEDHRGHELGDFKATILDMLSAYGYERAILVKFLLRVAFVYVCCRVSRNS